MGPKKWIVFGATSAIATAVLREAAPDGIEATLVSRTQADLDRLAKDLSVRGAARVRTIAWDVSVTQRQGELFSTLGTFEFDAVFVAYGTLPDQAACEADPTLAARAIEVNFTSTAALLLHVANAMRGPGTIGVITSVAGELGRRSNHVYGSAKGGLSIFLSGLRARLFARGIGVVDIRPGFIDTPMTAAFKKGPLFATPERIAPKILRAMRRQRAVVHVPWFWRWILWALRRLPHKVLYRLPI